MSDVGEGWAVPRHFAVWDQAQQPRLRAELEAWWRENHPSAPFSVALRREDCFDFATCIGYWRWEAVLRSPDAYAVLHFAIRWYGATEDTIASWEPGDP